jgi:hypothetical protein
VNTCWFRDDLSLLAQLPIAIIAISVALIFVVQNKGVLFSNGNSENALSNVDPAILLFAVEGAAVSCQIEAFWG